MELPPDATFLLDPVYLGLDTYHWADEDLLLFRSKTKTTRVDMFPGRDIARLSQMALLWNDHRDIWVSELIWVRILSLYACCALF
jgi:hypothetical protein